MYTQLGNESTTTKQTRKLLIKSPSPSSLDEISPKDFEELTLGLVRAMGFTSAALVAGPGDRGEDIVAFEPAAHAAIEPGKNRWVFQCKHVREISQREIVDELCRFEAEKLHTWVLVTSKSPSPEFRRWFERLEDSQRRHFRIQAWWRDDFISKLAHLKNELQGLPPKIVPWLLKIDAMKDRPDLTLQHLLTLSSRSTIARVERFAKGKYIPGLYVRRALTDELETFHEAEAITAKRLKEAIDADSKHLSSYLSDRLALFPVENPPPPPRPAKQEDEPNETPEDPTIVAERFEASNPGDVATNESASRGSGEVSTDHGYGEHEISNRQAIYDELGYTSLSRLDFLRRDIRRVDGELTRYLNEIAAQSERWINELRTFITRLTAVGESLADDRYFDDRGVFAPAIQLIDNIVALIGTMPIVRHELDKGHLAFGMFPEQESAALHARLKGLKRALEGSREQRLLIVDRAGGGKTNLLCHFALSMATAQPTLLLFGKETVDDQSGIVGSIERELLRACHLTSQDLAVLDKVLEREGVYLHILLDGINETRQIPKFDQQLARMFEWINDHRVRVSITCRDIYWSFFNREQWAPSAELVFHDRLREFSLAEYELALELYLKHFRIECILDGQAKVACQHPLLLRFFCEAYGEPHGPLIRLGQVRDIRLKQLFDVYFQRKMKQIADALGHRNADSVTAYLARISSFMFEQRAAAVVTSEIVRITSDPDLSSDRSSYLRLLDEDIILEEQPTDDVGVRRVTFVYEEFMEFLIARSILMRPSEFGLSGLSESFGALKDAEAHWVNARGVVEYIALMALSGDFGYSHTDAMMFMSQVASDTSTAWRRVFWSIIGKCREEDLTVHLLDLFWAAIGAMSDAAVAKACMTSMSRYSERAAEKLAGVILWTVAVPKVLSWAELELLHTMSKEQLENLSQRLMLAMSSGKRFSDVGVVSYGALLNSIQPFVTRKEKVELEHSEKLFGKPGKRRGLGRSPLIRVLCGAFPAYSPMLINGLFVDDPKVQALCADRLRFVGAAAPQVTFLLKHLVKVMKNREAARILRFSCDHLEAAQLERRY